MTEREILFSEVLNCNRMSLYQNRALPLNSQLGKYIGAALKRRILGEPLQYILGKTEFMGLEFRVGPGVLIPRQETEMLVESALKVSKGQSAKESECQSARVLDLGTGSGCIAITLAKFLPQAKIDAIDISQEALKIARENADLNGVKINFLQGDLFNTYSLQLTAYSLIISNPPYIASDDISSLQPEIAYEPRIALDGGKDGLDFYRRIAANAGGYLKKNGLLLLEIGYRQLESIKNIFQKAEKFEIIEVVKDYNNIERVVIVKLSRKVENSRKVEK